MADERELDIEFKKILSQIDCNLQGLNFREKLVATEWMSKFIAQDLTKDEKCIRNDFLEFLLKSSAKDELKTPPFNSIPPPKTPVLGLLRLLPQNMRKRSSSIKSIGNDELIKEIFEKTCDKGEFLSTVPVPKNGSFSVLIMRKE